MRPLAIGRKNWLFAGNDQAAAHAAVLYSLIQTCKLNGINTFAYLKDVLARLPTTKMADIHTLFPYHWQPLTV
jgi:transposase